jgi:multisubunit Na+/H+ antiporter MnhB subunit
MLSLVWEDVMRFALLGVVMVLVVLIAFIFLVGGWSVLTHPTPIKGFTSTVPETTFVGGMIFAIGLCVVGVGIEIIRRLTNYPRKWSTGALR